LALRRSFKRFQTFQSFQPLQSLKSGGNSPQRKNAMKRSTERILTTHVGSLARADSLIPLLRLREQGQPYDRDELARQVREAVAEVVRKQVEAGIDIVTDGGQRVSRVSRLQKSNWRSH
jgi:hypothetical protein